jgi:hypothetical protein
MPRRRPQPRARLAKAAAVGVVVEVVAVGAAQKTRLSPQKRSKPGGTKRRRSQTPPRAPPKVSVAGVVVGGGGEKRRLPPQTTRRRPLFEYANRAVRKPTTRFLELTDQPGWRLSGSGDAKVGRQVGVERRS